MVPARSSTLEVIGISLWLQIQDIYLPWESEIRPTLESSCCTVRSSKYNAKMLQASNGNNNAGLFTTDVAPIDPKQSGIYLRWQDISNGLVSLDSDIILKVPFVGKSARNHMVVFFCLAPTASTPGAKSFSPTTRRGTRINPLGVLVTLKLLT